MKKEPSVTVIILNFNGIEDTRLCLNSVLKTNYSNFSVIVVDNGSITNEADLLHREFKSRRLNFIRFKRNLGFAGGNNKILRTLKTKYVVLLNNDTVVTASWLRKLTRVAESSGNIAACQPKIKSLSKREFFDYAGAAGGFIDKFGFPFARGRIFFSIERDEGQYDNIVDIFWASGSALLLRISVLKKVGLFDESFFAYHEETDLCWRLHERGFRIVVVPNSVVYHKGLGTSGKNIPFRIFLVHRNMLAMSVKHLPLSLLIVRPVFDLASIIFYILSGELRLSLVVVKAYVSFFLNIRRHLRDRLARKVLFSNENSISFYGGSIVWDYFILGKRRYSEIVGGINNSKIIQSSALVNIDRVIQKRIIINAFIQNFSFSSRWNRFSGERTFSNVDYLAPTFSQHQKVYEFCTKFVKNKRVIDIGCGSGAGTYTLSKKAKEVLGIDSNKGAVNFATNNYRNKNILFKNIGFLDFSMKQKYDVVTSLQVIEHFDSPTEYLLKINRLLKKRGLAIFSTPNRITQSYNENPFHFKEYSKVELADILGQYFSKVQIFSLYGNDKVRQYEKERRNAVLRILHLDKIGIRKLIPRSLRMFVFGFLTMIIRRKLVFRKVKTQYNITKKDFLIGNNFKEAIDLIAICEK